MSEAMAYSQEGGPAGAARETRRQFLARPPRIALGLGAASLLGTLAACGSSETGAKPRRGGTVTIGFGDATPHDKLDPRYTAGEWITVACGLIYDPLIVADDNLRPHPGIVTAWEVSNDNRVWILHVRKGVEFHDGTKLTARDVAHSIRLQLDPKGGSPIAGTVGKMLPRENVNVDGPYTVRLELLQPNVFLYVDLQSRYFRVVKDGVTDFTGHPVGTGPFKFKKFVPGQLFAAERNAHYWQHERPYLDQVQITNIPEPSAQYQALLGGQLDLTQTIDYTLARRLQDKGKRALVLPNALWVFMVMDARRNKLFANGHLVDAVKLAVDREQIKSNVYAEYASIGYDQPLPESDPFFDRGLPQPKRDVAAAREALAAAGYPHGVDIGELVAAPVTSSALQLAQVLQQQLAEAGIRLRIKQWPTATFWDDVYLSKPLYISYNNRRHGSEAWRLFYGSHAEFRETGFANARFDRAAAAADAATNRSEQKALFGVCQQIVTAQDTRVVPAYASRVFGSNARLKGVRPNLITYADFTSAYLA